MQVKRNENLEKESIEKLVKLGFKNTEGSYWQVPERG